MKYVQCRDGITAKLEDFDLFFNPLRSERGFCIIFDTTNFKMMVLSANLTVGADF